MIVRRSLAPLTSLLFASCLTMLLHSALGAEEQGTAPPLPVSPLDVHPILVRTKVPDVPLMTVEGSPVGLVAALSGKPTILVFYRGWW